MVESPGKCVDTSRTWSVRRSKLNKQIVLCSTAEKKNCLLWIGSEKNCMFRLAVKKKSLITKKNQSPLHVSNSPPLSTSFYVVTVFCCLVQIFIFGVVGSISKV